jgi:prolyl-tRNA synthetase
MMQDGKALQAGTSHYLGENFAKAFDVKFQDVDKELKYVHATSWGVSTRLIGGMIMSHSDDNGLVVPPKARAAAGRDRADLAQRRGDGELVLSTGAPDDRRLGSSFFKIDDRDHVQARPQVREWEIKGIPIRIEIGPRDVANNGEVVVVRRDTGEKTPMPIEACARNSKACSIRFRTDLFTPPNNACGQHPGLRQLRRLQGARGRGRLLPHPLVRPERRLRNETPGTRRKARRSAASPSTPWTRTARA